MSDVNETYIRIALYVVGWALSIAWPFLLVAVTEGAKFDVRKVSGRILGGLLGLVIFLVGNESIATIGAMSFLAAFVAGFGASEVGNNGRRTVDAKRA